MDLRSQLKMLFPDHQEEVPEEVRPNVWMQDEPLLCKYEKRNGKPITVLTAILRYSPKSSKPNWA